MKTRRELTMLLKLLLSPFEDLLKILTYFLSLVIPKNPKIWIFGGWYGERFADNSRYFYQYISMNKERFELDKVIWVTRNDKIIQELKNQGYEVYNIWSLKSIWYHLRSSVFINDQSLNDLNSFFLHRGILLSLWHGFPLKRIGVFMHPQKKYLNLYLKAVQIIENIVPGLRLRYRGKNSYFIAQSEFASEIFSKAFNIPMERIIIAGYPRDDVLSEEIIKDYYLNSELPTINIIKNLKQIGKKIILYLPTYRDNSPTFFFGTNNLDEILELRSFLLRNNFVLITKFHFATNKTNSILEDGSQFIKLNPDTDIYPILILTDILITDYSSIAFDFLYLDRPIIYYPYDLEYYNNEDRGLLFEYEEYTPGPKIFNLTDLMMILKEIFDDNFIDNYTIKRKVLLEKIHDLKYNPGSPIIATEFKQYLR